MTKDQFDTIRARLAAALTYEPSVWNEEEGAYVSPSEKADENSECPLCDGQGFVWSQRYDAKETIAATVVAYGIGDGLARAEEWVEQAPADMRALLDEVERLRTERDDLLAWSQRFSDLVGVDGSTEGGRDEAFAKLYDAAKAAGKLVKE